MLKRPVINTAVQTVAKIVTILISLVTTGILTRNLGAEVYGGYVLINSVFLLLDAVADLGTRIIGVREAAELNEAEKPDFYKKIGILRLIISSLAFGAGLIFSWWWPGFEDFRNEATIALIMIFGTSVAGSMEIIFQSQMRLDLKALVDIAFPLLFLIMLLGFGGEISLAWVFGGYLAARVLSLVWGWSLILKIGIKRISLKVIKIDLEWAKRMLKASWPMGLYLLIFTGYDRAVDSMMIRSLVGVKEVAWYGLAYKIYSNLQQPAYFLVSNIFPLLSTKSISKRKLYRNSAVLLIGSAIIIMGASYWLAPWMVQILAGEGYEASVGALRWLLIPLFFSYLGHLSGFGLISEGGQREMLLLGMATLILNVGLNLLAIPRWGIEGAAIVTGLTEMTALGLTSWRLWIRTNKAS